MSPSSGSSVPGPRDADRTIAMFREAVAAGLADRYRRGCVVHLPPEGEVLVAGDLHGNRVNLIRVLKAADLEHHPQRHLILQEAVHGGPNSSRGGCLSFIVFEGLAALKAKYPHRVHILLGNHELAEHMGQLIFKDGVLLNRTFAQGMTEAYGERAEEVRACYRRFIETMAAACRTPHGLFISHSTPDGRSLADFDPGFFADDRLTDHLHRQSSLYRLVWGRDYRPETADRFAQLVEAELFLVSHTPCPRGYEVPNHRHLIIQSYDEAGCYVLVPLDRPVSQAELVASVRRLLTDRHPDEAASVELEAEPGREGPASAEPEGTEPREPEA